MVVLGTATPGGGFPVYGQAYAETLNATDPTLSIQPKNTKGSTDNLPQLEAGQLDLGQVISAAPRLLYPSAEDWAVATGTISYEIVTRMSSRLPRYYRTEAP